MVAVDFIKDPGILDKWPLRRILKYSRLHNWANTSTEDRKKLKEDQARAEWAKKIKASQKDYAANKVIPKAVLEGAG